MAKAPYIIIGMHRSGTSLVAKILEKSGIFMGVIKDHNYEAMHFLSLNQQSMYAAGGSWLDPVEPEEKHWKIIPANELYREHFRINTLQQKLVTILKNPRWGWKDPRNTFTLPMWLHLFPNAKVIHVFRDKDEVATSLQKRNTVKGEVFDPRLDDIEFNRQLHEKYLIKARSYAEVLGSNFHELSYNQLIDFDKDCLNKLENFCKCNLRKSLKKYVH